MTFESQEYTDPYASRRCGHKNRVFQTHSNSEEEWLSIHAGDRTDLGL